MARTYLDLPHITSTLDNDNTASINNNINTAKRYVGRPSGPSLTREPFYRQVALLIALGWSNVKIAGHLSYTSHTISGLRNDPLIIPIVKEFQSKMEDKVIAQRFIKRLLDEFDASMDKIAHLRDKGEEEMTQLNSARFLVEKAIETVVPKKSQVEETKKVGVVILNGADVQDLLKIMREDTSTIDIDGQVEVSNDG